MIREPHIAPEPPPKFSDHPKRPAVEPLSLERVEERFHVRVFVGRRAPGHALLQTVVRHAATKPCTEVFAAAIAVEHHTPLRSPPSKRCVEHGPGQARIPGAAQPPRQHPP